MKANESRLEIELSESIEVPINLHGTEFESSSTAIIEFRGRKGAMLLWELQSQAARMAFAVAKSIPNADAPKEDHVEKEPDNTSIEEQRHALTLSLSFSAEYVAFRDKILDALAETAKIGGCKLVRKLQEKLSVEDLEKICENVTEHFLLKKIFQLRTANESKPTMS